MNRIHNLFLQIILLKTFKNIYITHPNVHIYTQIPAQPYFAYLKHFWLQHFTLLLSVCCRNIRDGNMRATTSEFNYFINF